MTISISEEEAEEYERAADSAAGYYLGLWNILKKEEAPTAVIINAAINNMLAVLDAYMANDAQISMLEAVVTTVKKEKSLASEKKQ